MKDSKTTRMFQRALSAGRILMFAFLSALAVSLSAQNKSVSGTVVDDGGNPIIGASVLEKGTTNGTITDIDGNFRLQNVPNDASLEVSYVGYVTQVISVSGKTHIDVQLKEDAELLDEVVVVGYGVQRKSDVTGALTQVSSKELTTRPVSNAFEALQGKAAGVDITTSERPGTLGSILVRGTRSLSADSDPLYVVDGVPLQNGDMSNLNPRDIESISILKDASSTAIYGSRGANGVIMITTKRGKAGALTVSYSSTLTFETIKDKNPVMNPDQYITMRRWAYYNAGLIDSPGDTPDYESDQTVFADLMVDATSYANVMNGWGGGTTTWDSSLVEATDWTGMVTQTGITHEHSISVSGGTEKFTAYASFGYLNNQGTMKGQDYERYNGAVNVDIQAKPWFKMGASVSVSHSTQQYGYSKTGQSSSSGASEIYSAAKSIFTYALPFDEDGNITTYPGGVSGVYTVYDQWDCSNDQRKTFRAQGAVYAIVDFGKIWKPLEGLTYKINFGPEFSYYRKGIYIPSDSAIRLGGTNYASWSHQDKTAWTLDNQITYAKTIKDHRFDVTLLQTASKYHYESASMSAVNIDKDSFLWNNMGSVDVTNSDYDASMSTGLTEKQIASYMARINYAYKDRYLLTVSGRYDGSSVLAEGNKWDFFPSAALGWRMDQEEFMKDISWIEQLKVRVGVGVTGNAAVDAYSTSGSINSYYVPFGGSSNVLAYTTNEPYYSSSSSFVQMANKDLGWEKTTQWNVGVDFSVLRGRIGGTLDVYFSRTKDLLMDMTVPTLTGYSSTLANVGETKNKGVEITINAIPIQTKDFTWNTSFNCAWQKDEIVELANGKQDMVDNAWFIGESINVYYGYAAKGLWQEDDATEMAKFNDNGHDFEAGKVKPVDQNGDYTIDTDDRVIIGNTTPRWTLGWNNTFTYKDFELNIQMVGRFGYTVNMGGRGLTGYYNQTETDYWTPTNTGAEFQKPIYSTSGGDSYSSLLGYVDASFLKVRNISLGYNLPKRLCAKIGAQSLRVYVQAKNPGMIYCSRSDMDLDTGTVYYNKGYTIGLDMTF